MWTFEMERMQDFNWKVCKTFWKNRKIANFKVLKGKDLHIWNVQIWIFKKSLAKVCNGMRFTNFGEKESFERKLKTPNLEKESFLRMSNF